MLVSSRPLLETRADQSLFVGRDAETAAVESAVTAGLNTLVLGDWGSGKTSFLRHCAWRLRDRRTHWVEVVDGGLATDAQTLMALVADKLLEPSEGYDTRAVGGLAASIASNGQVDPAARIGLLTALVDRLRRELPELIDRPPADRDGEPAWDPGLPVVVLLDNAVGSAAHVLFGRMRDEIWSLPITWVVTGDLASRATYLEPPADAFFDERVVLGPMDEQTAVAVLKTRLNAGPDSGLYAGVLQRIADGVPTRAPRHLVMALREVVNGRAGSSPEAVDQAAHEQRDRANTLATLGRPAAMLVAELQARGGSASASDDGLQESLGWTRSRAAQVFGQLEEAGLVTVSERRVPGAGRPRKVYELVGRVL